MVFSLSALWWRRIRGLWKLPDRRDWPRGKLDLVLMVGPMLRKCLIQFSVDVWGCVPSLLFTWCQSMMEVMKTMATSFQRPHAGTAALIAPTLQQATGNPRLCWRLLDTHAQVIGRGQLWDNRLHTCLVSIECNSLVYNFQQMLFFSFFQIH